MDGEGVGEGGGEVGGVVGWGGGCRHGWLLLFFFLSGVGGRGCGGGNEGWRSGL